MGCNKGVSAEELRAIFDGLDSSKDGKLGKGELDTYMTVKRLLQTSASQTQQDMAWKLQIALNLPEKSLKKGLEFLPENFSAIFNFQGTADSGSERKSSV